jgi:hypothetical protein
LGEWRNIADDGDALTEISRPDLSAILQLLAHSKNGGALEHVVKLLRDEPQHTAVVCRYLRDIASVAPYAVYSQISESIKNLSLTKWQAVWILDSLVRVFDPDDWGWVDLGSLVPWIRRQAQSSDPILASHAILTLARHKLLTLREWNHPLASKSDYSEPFRIASLAGLKTGEKKVPMTDSLLGRIMEPWAKREIT